MEEVDRNVSIYAFTLEPSMAFKASGVRVKIPVAFLKAQKDERWMREDLILIIYSLLDHVVRVDAFAKDVQMTTSDESKLLNSIVRGEKRLNPHDSKYTPPLRPFDKTIGPLDTLMNFTIRGKWEYSLEDLCDNMNGWEFSKTGMVYNWKCLCHENKTRYSMCIKYDKEEEDKIGEYLARKVNPYQYCH